MIISNNTNTVITPTLPENKVSFGIAITRIQEIDSSGGIFCLYTLSHSIIFDTKLEVVLSYDLTTHAGDVRSDVVIMDGTSVDRTVYNTTLENNAVLNVSIILLLT